MDNKVYLNWNTRIFYPTMVKWLLYGRDIARWHDGQEAAAAGGEHAVALRSSRLHMLGRRWALQA
jgi:hypothetical protein